MKSEQSDALGVPTSVPDVIAEAGTAGWGDCATFIPWGLASLDTVHGRLACRWERTEDGYQVHVTVPNGTEAAIILPSPAGHSRPTAGIIPTLTRRHNLCTPVKILPSPRDAGGRGIRRPGGRTGRGAANLRRL